jgi:hypothetical protein
MFGWLKRKVGRLKFERTMKKLWEAVGISQDDLREENDNGALLSFKVDEQMPPLSGFEEDVRVVRSSTGIVLIKESDGAPISDTLAPSQEILQRIPADIDEADFAYLIVKSKYGGNDKILSCVVERSGQHYGDGRAFWWSLAKKEVYWKSKAINATRMTKKSLSQVIAIANGTWGAVVEHSGPIDNMRDQLVLSRNVDLDVLSKLKDHYDSKSAKFGVDIARAMIFATQSEDPKLEAVAFERFKQFMWQPGEEPKEFLQHDT